MPRAVDLTGHQFGRLQVIGLSHSHRKHRYWHCLCSCGAQRVVRGLSLTSGRSRSCGCLMQDIQRERLRKRETTHGRSGTREYVAWCNMKTRCYNPRSTRFDLYGGRGIAVCEAWRNSFEQFYADMGPSSAGMSLDRIDPDGDYSPENCRWADQKTQSNNVRRNHRFTVQGVERTLGEWAEHRGVTYELLRGRILRYGWHPVIAILTPPGETNILS